MGSKLEDTRKAVLKQLNVSEESIAFLEEISIPLLREWACLCMAEGMARETIDALCQQTKENKIGASEVFLEERERNLRSLYENNRELGDRFDRLSGEVKAMHQRASSTETALDETIKAALHEKDSLYGKIIEGKDEILQVKDKQITAMEKQLADMQDRIRARDDRILALEDRLKTAEAEPGEDRESGVPDSDDTNPLPLPRMRDDVYSFRPRLRLFPGKKEREAEQFIRQFMENEDYTNEQKEFLIRCLEQGDTVEFIREYASPRLSIAHMAWLRQIVGGRMRHER